MDSNDIFLAYANNDLRKNPQYLSSLASSIIDTAGIPVAHADEFLKCADFAVKLSELKSFQEADAYYEKLKQDRLIAASAFSHVFGYKEGYCFGACPQQYLNRTRILGDDLFEGNDRLKCFECDQLYFKFVLDSIIEGKDLSDIMDFYRLLQEVSSVAKKRAVIKSGKDQTEYIDLIPDWTALFLMGFSFPFVLRGVVVQSLVDFLIQEKRQKLKKCPFCGDYFIAKDVRRIKCTKAECEKAYQRNKKRKQRKDDPVKYF